MYRHNNINILNKRIIYNTSICILYLFVSPFLYAQEGLTIEAPNNLELNCLNTDYAIITSWLMDYSYTNTCQGNVRVTNDFDGILPGICGEPKFVKWIITNECNQIDSAGATLTIDSDLVLFGFEYCPNTITVFAKIDSCGADVTFPEPYARNCFGPMTTKQVSNSNSVLVQSGETFDLGETEIVYIAEDECSKLDTCRFSVIVINSNDLVSLYCPDDENIRVCSNIDGCGWDSSGELIRPGTAFLDCSLAEIDYRLELPTGETITAIDLEDDDGDATGYLFPMGETRLCYTIRNPGGAITCCFNVIVEDCTPPRLICPSAANLSCDRVLDQSTLDEWISQAIVQDNCDNFTSIRTMILDTIGICGANERIEVLFIASDVSRNESACVANINVTDIIGPQITVERLPDLVMECKGIVRNQQLLIEWLGIDGGFNESHVMNNCPSEVTWTFDPSTTNFQTETNFCSSNVGFYDVKFTATDRCGNESNSAMARLVFEDTTPPSVTFPDDLSLDCDLNNLENSVEMLLQNIVAIDSCSGYTVRSSFDLNLVECVVGDNQLEVNFTATDACGNESVTMGVINLTKQDRSTISAPDDLILRCGEDADSLITLWLDDFSIDAKCDSIEVLNNYDESRVDLCGAVQQVIWVLRDTCGATTTATSQLTIVSDDRAPIFLNCPVNVSLDVENSNCTATYLFDIPKVEDCQSQVITVKQSPPPAGQDILTSGSDFPIGTTTLMFTATDNCNNTSECSFNVTVREDPVCAQGGLSIQGCVKTPTGEELQNVDIILTAPLTEFPKTERTSINGNYSFTNLPNRIDYAVSLRNSDDAANGLSTVDLIQIRNHILGTTIFNTPLKTIAADANNDGSLSSVDIILLQNIIIGFQDTLPNSRAWKFVSKTEIDNTTLLPWPSIDQFTFPNLRSNRVEDFIGLKVGDVNYSAQSPGLQSPREIRSDPLYLHTENKQLRSQQEYDIDFFIDDQFDAKGFQLELQLQGIDVLVINSAAFKITTSNVNYEDDLFVVNSIEPKFDFKEGPYLSIKVIAEQTIDVSKAFKLSHRILNSELYVGDDLEVKDLALNIDQPMSGLSAMLHPNPFSEEAKIQIHSDQEGLATLYVYNSSGAEIVKKTIFLRAGTDEFSLSKSELMQSGIYFYALHIGKQNTSGKFMLLD